MALYENVFIVRQDTPNQRVEELAGSFSQIIVSGGGEVKKTEFWGVKSLAYKIKKNRKGHYVLLNIDAPSSALLEMERAMLLDEDVIRHLSVRVEKLEEDSSIMMRNRGEKDRGNQNDKIEGSEVKHNPPETKNEKGA